MMYKIYDYYLTLSDIITRIRLIIQSSYLDVYEVGPYTFLKHVLQSVILQFCAIFQFLSLVYIL